MAEIGHGLGLDERERWRVLRKARMNRILVIGGTGTVGRQVASGLAATGAQVRALARNPGAEK